MAELLSEEEVGKVLAAPKRIIEDIHWRKHEGYQKFSVAVRSEEADYDMTLEATLTEATGYVKVNLFVGSQPIVMMHRGKAHHNPDCARLTGRVHKHQWKDAQGERWAYEPAEIDFSSWSSLFHGFLRECNIVLEGRLPAPAVERRMF